MASSSSPKTVYGGPTTVAGVNDGEDRFRVFVQDTATVTSPAQLVVLTTLGRELPSTP
jgi:hypothetical protein